MKKKIFGGILAVAIAALAAVNVNINNESEDALSALSLANVEALASGEEEEDEGKTCYNSITTKEGSQVLYCQSCSWVDGTSTWYSGTDKC